MHPTYRVSNTGTGAEFEKSPASRAQNPDFIVIGSDITYDADQCDKDGKWS
jgi:hypothetical protein